MEAAELTKYKNQLLEMKQSLLARILKINVDKQRKSGALDDDSSEQAIQIANDEVIDALDEHDQAELSQIDKALLHIESGTYGKCNECGKSISAKRLEAVPFAIECINCTE